MMLATMVSLWLSVVVVLLSTTETSSVFLPKEIRGFADDEAAESVKTESKEGRQRMDDRATSRSKAPTAKAPFFKDDADISWYLKIFDRKVMIWRCRNAIKNVNEDGHLDLSCSVIGKLWSISWHHKGKEIASYVGKFGRVIDADRYSLSVTSHVDRSDGHRFSNWNDVRLRIHNASSNDDHHSGVYRFTVTHYDGPSQQHRVFVDLTDDKHKTRKTQTNERHRRTDH